MTRTRRTWKQLAFKTIFMVVGLVLFTAEVSCKFYRSASMPVYRSFEKRPGRIAHRLFSCTDHSATLSLDKRFDLEPAFASPAPFLYFHPDTGPGLLLPCFIGQRPVGNRQVPISLRGPPVCVHFS